MEFTVENPKAFLYEFLAFISKLCASSKTIISAGANNKFCSSPFFFDFLIANHDYK